MSANIYLRPLKIEDAQTSYKWRNDPEIWTYTDFVCKNVITPQVEKDWLANILNSNHQKRYAICIKDTDEYIGNIQLINLQDKKGEFEMFIGEKRYWGKGIGYEATKQMLDLAFSELNLNSVYLYVHPDNIIAMRCYYRAGFIFTSQEFKIKMTATLSSYSKSLA